MRPPRGLNAEEAALWARLAATVRPLTKEPSRFGKVAARGADGGVTRFDTPPPPLRGGPPPRSGEVPALATPRPLDRHGLDGGWERKVTQGAVRPDFTIDLHGHGLDAAHSRLDHGLALALVQGARVVLVITGRPRPVDAADRGSRRGAIRAKLIDWLAAGQHASSIAAVRPAHQKHGGAGAVYVVLKRPRGQDRL
jgi:DNA-nicking Smr family endonuclease